jgi:hypothetical protein
MKMKKSVIYGVGSACKVENRVKVVVNIIQTNPVFGGLVGLNKLTGQPHRLKSWEVFDRRANSSPGPVTDDDLTRLNMYFNRSYGLNFARRKVLKIVIAWAAGFPFDPAEARAEDQLSASFADHVIQLGD